MLELEVRCEKCGQKLDAEIRLDRKNNVFVEIEPCAKCLEEAREDGREEEGAR